jgi:hypothetical protein
MLAAASGKSTQRTPNTWPNARLERGDAELELSDLRIEANEVDLTDGRAFDRVRRIVDDAWGGKRDLRLSLGGKSETPTAFIAESSKGVSEPSVDDELTAGKAVIETRVVRSGGRYGKVEDLDRIPGPERHAAAAERPVL